MEKFKKDTFVHANLAGRKRLGQIIDVAGDDAMVRFRTQIAIIDIRELNEIKTMTFAQERRLQNFLVR